MLHVISWLCSAPTIDRLVWTGPEDPDGLSPGVVQFTFDKDIIIIEHPRDKDPFYQLTTEC